MNINCFHFMSITYHSLKQNNNNQSLQIKAAEVHYVDINEVHAQTDDSPATCRCSSPENFLFFFGFVVSNSVSFFCVWWSLVMQLTKKRIVHCLFKLIFYPSLISINNLTNYMKLVKFEYQSNVYLYKSTQTSNQLFWNVNVERQNILCFKLHPFISLTAFEKKTANNEVRKSSIKKPNTIWVSYFFFA